VNCREVYDEISKVHDFIAKPVAPDAFLRKIRELLDRI
jgi:hypothetical protein